MVLIATIIFGISIVGAFGFVFAQMREEKTGKVLIPLSFQDRFEKKVFGLIDGIKQIIHKPLSVRIKEAVQALVRIFVLSGQKVSEKLAQSESPLVRNVRGERKLTYARSQSSFLGSIHEHKRELTDEKK